MTSIPTHLCFPPPLLRLSSSSHRAPSSWIQILRKITSFPPVLKGSSMVRYPFCSLTCTLANIPGLGIYSGIFVMYLQCQSDRSTGRTATIVFYAICLLYILSTVSFISDLAAATVVLEPDVSNNSICSKDIIFYQSSSRLWFYRFPLQLSNSHQLVVVISSPNVF